MLVLALLAALIFSCAMAAGPVRGPGAWAAIESAEAQIRPGLRAGADDRGRIYSDECIVMGSSATRSPLEKCVYGVPESDEHVVLFGDSHALQYGPALIRLAEEKGWRLTALIRQGCLIAQVRLDATCNTWRRRTVRRIARRERPDLIVVSTATTKRYALGRRSRRDSQARLVRGMIKTLRRLRDTGARVALIRDQHISPRKLPDCIWLKRAARKPNEACGFKPDGRRHRQGFDYTAGRSVKQVRVIDPAPKLCPGGDFCPVVKGGILLYRDRYHLTATYARHIAPWLGRQLPRVQQWRSGGVAASELSGART